MAEQFDQYLDPRAYQQSRQAQDMANALSYSKMDPSQRTAMAGYQLGGALGKAAGGLFGIKDRGLEEVTAASEIMKGVDRTDYKALYEAAKVLGQRGLMNAGEAVFRQAQQLEKQTADLEGTKAKTQKEIALANAADARAERELKVAENMAKGEGFKNLPPEVQAILKLAEIDPSYDKVKAMKEYLDNKTSGKGEWSDPYTLGGATVQRNNKTGEIKTAVSRPPVTTITAGGAAKPLSTRDIQEINKLRSSVNVASTNVGKADDYLTKLDNKLASFGAGPNAASSMRTFFGSTVEGDRIKQGIGRFTTASVNAVLNAAKGAQTEGDAKRAQEQILTGLQKNDMESVKEGLRELRRIHEEIKTNDSESLELFGQERKRDLTPKTKETAKGTKTTKSGVSYQIIPD